MKKSLLLLLILTLIGCEYEISKKSEEDFIFSFKQGQFNRETFKTAIKKFIDIAASNDENATVSLYNVYSEDSSGKLTPLTDHDINLLAIGIYDITLTLEIIRPNGSSSLPNYPIKFKAE